MKKIFLFLTIAFGMFAMSSCKCTSNEKNAQEFVYDVVGTAEGVGSFGWEKNINTGAVTLNGEFVVKATNDTTSVKVLSNEVCDQVMYLSDGLVSNDADVAEAARCAKERLLLDLNLNGFTGNVKLALTGYVKYGMMIFALDEHWQYPPVEAEVVE